MAILRIFTTYLYAMSYGEPEHAARIKCLDDIYVNQINSTSPFFLRKTLEICLLLFIVLH